MNQPILNNRYRIIKTLANGGFGETFLAQDTQMPSGRLCVLKQLKPIVNNPQIYQLIQERFQREAAILEDLGETNNQIPQLYAYFTENGQFYLVQEWIKGETLTTKVQNQGLFNDIYVQEILMNLLPVLDYIHSKRIIHRDIKPGNIIWRETDNLPVLIDFGAVKELMGTVLNSKGNPSRSIVIGTPGFMPPEQAAGHPVYGSDLYSLGLTAIYLLTGKNPRELQTDSPWEKSATNVSPRLVEILNRVIKSNPSDRYSTATEMLDALNFGSTASAPTAPSPAPPILLPLSAAPPAPGPTLVTSAPPEASEHPQTLASNPPTPRQIHHRMGDWQKAIITGSIIGGFILLGIFLSSIFPSIINSISQEKSQDKSQDKPQDKIDFPPNTPSPTPTTSQPSQTPQPSPIPTINSISEIEATNLIKTWLEAKEKMFAPPYNSQIAETLTTGDLYEKTAGLDGSINWLKTNNAYYKYGVQRLDSVEQFFANNDSATIKVKITEDYTLYRNGKIDPNETNFKTLTVIYNFKLVNGQWKISDSRAL